MRVSLPIRSYRKATIKEVAARAGVSTTTVSLFVKGQESVCSSETAHRIRQAVAEFDYTPSSLFRAVRQGRTSVVGACVAGVADFHPLYRDTFAERVFRGIAQAADDAAYAINHFPSVVRDGTTAAPFLNGGIDGLIFSAPTDDDRLKIVARAGLPVVALTRAFHLPDNAGAVYADEDDTVHLALSYLWERGHRRIAHLAGPHQSGTRDGKGRLACADPAIWRLQRFTAWMQERNVFDPALIYSATSWWEADTNAAIRAWRSLPTPPTAVFCANDELAYALIQSAQNAGCSMPNQLSVIGVDALLPKTDNALRLTSIDIPGEVIGGEAMQTLLLRMDGAPFEKCRVRIPVTHIREGSTVAVI